MTKQLRLITFLMLPLLLVVCNGAPRAPAVAGPTSPAVARPTSPAVVAPTPPAVTGGPLYHVNLTGADDNDGSADAPWRTIQHAVDQVAPGATIWVHAGTYAGARLERSGTTGAWLTLQAAPGATVILDRPGPNNRHDSILELETWEGSGTVNYWIVDGFEVTGASGWGIDLRGSEAGHSHHLIVRNNIVHDNGWPTRSTGIFTAFADDVQILDNESYANGEHGIYVSNSGDRPIIKGNHLHHNAACGLHLNGDLSLGGDGIISGALIEANIIYENGVEGGCSAINMDGVTDSWVVNNWLYENHGGGISIYRADGAVCSRGNEIRHNSIVQASDGRWAINVTDFAGDGTGCRDNAIVNNILYNQHPWRGAIELQLPAPPGFVSNYNVVIGRFSIDAGETVIDLAAWQALGYDAQAIVATPDELFVDPAGGDYHLVDDSPARDTGANGSSVAQDIDGQSRPFGPIVDRGADEFVALTAARFLPLLRAGG